MCGTLWEPGAGREPVGGNRGAHILGRRCLAPLASLTTVVALGACTSRPAPTPARRAASTVAIASFDFAESDVLAALYGGALRAAGFSVEFHLGAGPRELVAPAVAGGLVDFVPEYAGTALRFLTAASDPRPGDRTGVAATHRQLVAAAADVGM